MGKQSLKNLSKKQNNSEKAIQEQLDQEEAEIDAELYQQQQEEIFELQVENSLIYACEEMFQYINDNCLPIAEYLNVNHLDEFLDYLNSLPN